jgi:hypothetical protein
VGRLDLIVMSAAFSIFGLSLVFQSHRWHSTPAYHVLLLLLPAQAWGALFLLSGVTMGLSAWQFSRRWAVTGTLTLAFALTTGWMLAFIVRYLTSPNTTPETWVSWMVFDFLLLKVAVSIDRGPSLPPPGAEVAEFRQAVDDALSVTEADLKAVLEQTAARRREAVTAALDAYGDALRAIIPAPPPGDAVQQAIYEARHALQRAEEARAAGTAPQNQDRP